MEFSVEHRTASLGVGEFSDFLIGPRDAGDGQQGLWRAQLGTHWHQQLRAQTTADQPGARFEVPVVGKVVHQGWIIELTGRIDQMLQGERGPLLREIKTVTRVLPASEEDLRAEYPGYFAQLVTYIELCKINAPSTAPRGELVFIEVDTGLSQSVIATSGDLGVFQVQLERVTGFLNQRLKAKERLASLCFRSAFDVLRPGQESILASLGRELEQRKIVLFEAPTGFGKTGITLESALTLLRSGDCERLIYLTSKSTGQLQVAHTLSRMTTQSGGRAGGVFSWQIRNKREHCIHPVFHCSKDICPHLHNLEKKWASSGLSRFYLFENEDRGLENLRKAGRAASVCPYEITRAALACNDVWIGDYNYIFSPSNRGLFESQPGYEPSRTMLIIDEAHNLPSRVCDVFTHRFSATQANTVASLLHQTRAPSRFVQAWDQWTHHLSHLDACDSLTLADEDDTRHLIEDVAAKITTTQLDSSALGPEIMELIWAFPSFADELAKLPLSRLWWCPQPGELTVSCLDAAPAIGPVLRSFKSVLLVSATLTPSDDFISDCGLDATGGKEAKPIQQTPDRLGKLDKRTTRHLYRQITSGAELLRLEEESSRERPGLVQAQAPWREHAYDVAVDLRVDTSYQQRARFHEMTAATVASICEKSGSACVVFFPSYRYAEDILSAVRSRSPRLRIGMQPRLPDLAAQASWVEESLNGSDALFLVLGSSFAEGIDLLGGRVSHAMVVGPALPEVNPVQKARLADSAMFGREAAFRRVYQAPGIQKVNQALGRLVRAPGQIASVLLHCRRFAEPGYADLLSPEYRKASPIASSLDLDHWLDKVSRP